MKDASESRQNAKKIINIFDTEVNIGSVTQGDKERRNWLRKTKLLKKKKPDTQSIKNSTKLTSKPTTKKKER